MTLRTRTHSHTHTDTTVSHMQRYKDTLVFVRIAAVSLSACSFYRCLIFNLDMVFLWPHAHEDTQTHALTHTHTYTHVHTLRHVLTKIICLKMKKSQKKALPLLLVKPLPLLLPKSNNNTTTTTTVTRYFPGPSGMTLNPRATPNTRTKGKQDEATTNTQLSQKPKGEASRRSPFSALLTRSSLAS